MRLPRSVTLLVICGLAVVLSSGCEQFPTTGQGVRASVCLYPTAEKTVDPRIGFGYYYYMVDKNDVQKYEIDIDFVPNFGDLFYITLRADYLRILKGTFYAGGGCGIMYENESPVTNSAVYFMAEALAGYVWVLGSDKNPIPLDLRFTVQMPFVADNAPLILMASLGYEF